MTHHRATSTNMCALLDRTSAVGPRRPRHGSPTAAAPAAVAVLSLALVLAGGSTTETMAAATTVIHVDDDAASGGDGSARSPYDNLVSALAQARAVRGPVAIEVAPGDYHVDTTLVIDRALSLRGSTGLVKGGDGWPTGAVVQGTATRIIGASSLGTQPLVSIGRADAGVVSDVDVGGFVFQGTSEGVEALVTRVQGYSVHDNLFQAPVNLGVQSIASSGRIAGNYVSGAVTGIIVNGGYQESPSKVTVVGNRSVGNIGGGLLLTGSSFGIPELGDQLDAVARDNDLSYNTTVRRFSFGLRLFLARRDVGGPWNGQSTGNIRALLRGNRMVGNEIGFTADAGFVYRTVDGTCDPRVFTGTMDLTLVGNTLSQSRLSESLVTFTRNQSALDPPFLPRWQYLHGARFTISDRDGLLAGAWIDHPERDPYLGPCPQDTTNEPLANSLVYNGTEVPNGRSF